MSIRVLFFASLADIVGTREAWLDAGQFHDVRSVYSRFEKSNPRLADYRGSLMFAVNSEFADPDTAVADGDEVAFLPPVSGG
jgi:molybdopterin converting factor subunit 1